MRCKPAPACAMFVDVDANLHSRIGQGTHYAVQKCSKNGIRSFALASGSFHAHIRINWKPCSRAKGTTSISMLFGAHCTKYCTEPAVQVDKAGSASNRGSSVHAHGKKGLNHETFCGSLARSSPPRTPWFCPALAAREGWAMQAGQGSVGKANI